MKRAWPVLALALAPAAEAKPLHVEHAPPACLVAEKPPVLLACLTPRSTRADVRVLFRADDGPWYAAPLRFEMPCYRGALPRPTAGTPRVTYVIEARSAGMTARSAEHAVPVEQACAGPSAPIATARATWEAPEGAPRTPPGFEGTRARETTAGARSTPAPEPTAPGGGRATSARPNPPPPRAPAPPASPDPPESKGGHGLRNAAIVIGGAAAAGGTALALRSGGQESGPPATTGTGLPSSGIAGTYVGTETIVYTGSCSGTDDVVLNLQQSASLLSGVISFTVRTCPCCAAGRGANPVNGFVSDLRVDLTTPVGFVYSGSFAGNLLSGSLTGPGGISGTWSVEKR